VSTHVVPHFVVPLPQLTVHTLFEQTWPAPHVAPQVPQFCGSTFVSTQSPLQAVVPAPQMNEHVLFEQS